VGSFKFPNCGKSWAGSYNVSNTPSGWTTGQTQTYIVTVTNTGTQAWPAGASTPVHLGVHFAGSGGGYATSGYGTNSGWLTDQRYTLPGDLGPGGTVVLNISVTAPSTSGSLVLEYQMVKEGEFWFKQFADSNVVATASLAWQASYDATATPPNWTDGQTQTYKVIVTNTGTQTWPAGTTTPVHLGVHFASSRGGYGSSGYGTSSGWLTDQRYSLPSDLTPGAAVTLTISVIAPSSTGNPVLEYQMVKEGQFWFGQFADVNVVVSPGWQASYDVTATPANWTNGQTQTYNVTITNTGTQAWPALGATPVHLGVHFASNGGGYGSSGYGTTSGWLTDQRYTLLADMAPGATMTLTISVAAPSAAGNLVLEYEMVKEGQFWYKSFADAYVTVH
jgi:hypothetical protein